ncbi:MAG: hypothetical protein PHG66_01820 [Candidatus Colwellbacteria bacterium]|nr:hypothetical protein [Candidatus Colwellbacteria bacterium]
MSIPVIYTDSEKSKYYSTDDYVTMSDYHNSFHTAQQTSQLRMVIAPGTVKYFNQSFTPQAIQEIQNPVYATQAKLTPVVSNGSDDCYDYMSYPKK